MNISAWDTSQVTDMSQMFYDAEKFNQPLNNWNVAKVTNMSEMFDLQVNSINHWTIGM
jgi:surface protein